MKQDPVFLYCISFKSIRYFYGKLSFSVLIWETDQSALTKNTESIAFIINFCFFNSFWQMSLFVSSSA
jgi:hypothetical protein